MCFVSLVAAGIPAQGGQLGSFVTWPDKQVLDFAEVISRLDKIDKALNLRDCRDAEKDKMLTELIARVVEIKKQSKPKKRAKK